MSRRILQIVVLGSLWATTPMLAADLDASTLIERLARPAPASIAFAEIRFSPLLDEPTVVSGRLSYSDAKSLERLVTEPYLERTTIRGESVRVERDGESARTFALRRAPELRGLLTGFSALLSGDAAALEQNFEVAVQGDDRDWTLTLTPRDTRAQKRIKHLRTFGHGDEPTCFSIVTADGAQSFMLLGENSADEDLAQLSAEQVAARCSAPVAVG